MKFQIHPKEKLYLKLMTLSSVLMYFIFITYISIMHKNLSSLTYLISFIYFMIFSFVVNLIGSLLFICYLKGNAIKINKKQFPDIFGILELYSQKLDLQKTPDMYLLQGNGVLNAFATKFLRRNYVILHSDVLEIAYQEGMDAVSFIIGHELGHIKRNHMSFFKTSFLLPSKFIPFLANAYSRACEYTCDNIGYNLCPKGALKGILVLAAGKTLYKKVNVNELILNITNESHRAITFGELFSTHPALSRRILAIDQLNSNNLTPDDVAFVSPNINPDADIKQSNPHI